MDLKAAYARALADRDGALTRVARDEETLAESRRAADELEAICRSLFLAIEMYEKPLEELAPVADRPAVADITVPMAPALVDASAILRDGEEPTHVNLSFGTLRALGRPLDTDEIFAVVKRTGHKSERKQIVSALTWLKKQERVVRVAPSTWALPREEPQESFTPAAEAAGVSTAGENGHSNRSNVLTGAEQGPQPAEPASF